jgi:uncharacterized Tic20 family protein
VIPEPIDRGTARVLSAVAHGAIAFGLFGVTWLIALAISGVIWLYGRRNPEVRFHSEQAGCYQCSVLVINLLIVTAVGITGGISIFNILQSRDAIITNWATCLGFVLFLLWFLLTIGYGIYAALLVLAGKPFKYPIIGTRIIKQ